MIIKYFSCVDELVSAVCNEMKGKWIKYGPVHVGRVFGVKRYVDGGGELTEWDLEVTAFCSRIRKRLLLKIMKPILAFVRVGYKDDVNIVFYVYYDRHLFSEQEVEEIVKEFNELIKENIYAHRMSSG
jgi:hypothetical protein